MFGFAELSGASKLQALSKLFDEITKGEYRSIETIGHMLKCVGKSNIAQCQQTRKRNAILHQKMEE